MQLNDTKNSFGWVSIALHWVVAGFIIALYIISQGMDGGTEDEERAARLLHVSIGAIGFIFIAARVFWRIKQGEKPLPPASLIITILSRWVPRLLLVSVTFLIISGPLQVWSNGYDIRVFDWFVIPTPMAKTEWLHEFAEEVHEISSTAIFYLFILHVLGGLKHLFIDKDGIMQRMLYPKK